MMHKGHHQQHCTSAATDNLCCEVEQTLETALGALKVGIEAGRGFLAEVEVGSDSDTPSWLKPKDSCKSHELL